MALDPEEFKRKRQEKKAQQQAQSKKLKLRLIIAAAVLLVCGIAIVVMSLAGRNAGTEVPETTTEPPTTQTTEQNLPEETVPDTTVEPVTVLHFAATGDLNVTDRLIQSGGTEYDYSDVFMDVAPILANADLTTVNLEGNLCGAPYGVTASAPPTLMQTLHSAGVDMIQLANSYAINRGVSGLITTIDGVNQAGMVPVGAFKDQNAFEKQQGFTLFEVQGVKIAVVAFTKGMDGTTLPPGNENCVNVLYADYDSVYQKVDQEKITQVLQAVQQQQPDITIALLHWGSEYNDTISKSQQSIKKTMLAHGVDAIIGTHPHYVQKVEFDSEKGTLVAYSLGDFVSDAAKAGSEYSVILDIEITKNNVTGEASVTGYSYTPIFSVVEEGKPVRVVRIAQAMAAYESGHMDAVNEQTYEAMKYALQRIEARIHAE